ncbi:MAG TPA: hypothetical protein VI756_31405 [Blastocatellia bacterium]
MKKVIAALAMSLGCGGMVITAAPVTAPASVNGLTGRVLPQAAAQTEPQNQAKPAHPAAPKLSPIETVKRYLQKLGEPIDTAKSTADMVVSSHTDSKNAKVTIVIVNDKKKDLLGLYVYNFGNLKSAPDADAVFRYLLSANDAITIGAFFVDSDKDIGYKYFMNTAQLNMPTFESIYLTMALVAGDRRQEIRRLLGENQEGADRPASNSTTSNTPANNNQDEAARSAPAPVNEEPALQPPSGGPAGSRPRSVSRLENTAWRVTTPDAYDFKGDGKEQVFYRFGTAGAAQWEATRDYAFGVPSGSSGEKTPQTWKASQDGKAMVVRQDLNGTYRQNGASVHVDFEDHFIDATVRGDRMDGEAVSKETGRKATWSAMLVKQ